ncbi:MAG: hypothetical protein D3908_05665, partial [Candidatus Electrothrix sp. AUS4]|nr:hypothetical protein [Candidatus Electrothrix sp. AUS4]
MKRYFVFLLILLIPELSSAFPEATTGFDYPLPYNFSLNGGATFGEWVGPPYYSSWLYHPGEDWNVPDDPGGNCDGDKELDVNAAANGKVVYVNSSSWGGIVLQHNYKGETWYTQYGHVQNIVVGVGDAVYKGNKIAEIGDVGMEAGCAHLHFEVRESDHPNPTYGAYWSNTNFASIDNINDWYEDPDFFIAEHPEYSNTISVEYFWRRDDPIIASNQNGENNFDAQFGIKNNSSSSAIIDDMAIAILKDGSYLFDCWLKGSSTTISAGDTYPTGIQYCEIYNSGSYSVEARLKIGGNWETRGSHSFTVYDQQTSFPDLVVESPSVDDNTLTPGEDFKVFATVRNAGNGSSSATTLRYYL